jgi:hypothetical protein
VPTPEVRFDSDGRCFHVEANGAAALPGAITGPSAAFAEGLAVAHRLDGRVALIDRLGRELDLHGPSASLWVLPPHRRARAGADESTGATAGSTEAGVLSPSAHEDPEWTGARSRSSGSPA